MKNARNAMSRRLCSAIAINREILRKKKLLLRDIQAIDTSVSSRDSNNPITKFDVDIFKFQLEAERIQLDISASELGSSTN